MIRVPLMLIILPVLIVFSSATWRTDFAQAKQDAAKQDKNILLKFSGSDWCIPCIKMEKKLFDQDAFQHYATDHLLMVNADFPRQKKNKLSDELIKANEALAEQYNKEGHFPYTVLLDANGKVLKVWDGYKDITPEEFITDIKNATP